MLLVNMSHTGPIYNKPIKDTRCYTTHSIGHCYKCTKENTLKKLAASYGRIFVSIK